MSKDSSDEEELVIIAKALNGNALPYSVGSSIQNHLSSLYDV